MAHNTLQIYLNEIMFDRATLEVMHGYVATFASASVDSRDGRAGDDDECSCQMYISPMAFRVQRENVAGRADRIHQYDGDGLLLASFPSKDLDSISLTSFFIRDHSRSRDTATMLENLFEGEGQGQALVDALLPLVKMLPSGGLAASAVIGLLPDVARLIARVLKNRRDAIKIYADGSLNFRDPARQVDSDQAWGKSRGDKGYFNTTWDFCTTRDPYAPVHRLTLPKSLKERLGLS
ncbi:hypothetical protein [Nannocystis bainbridge]|uniref:Uncharacterized protein n=1 Tax=Nannocystis bainbridge TaxID=2995303 RepID=A0ABT5E621_9BACT|nr:hypothetical protein [Nannocystis bainbridge]MDC0721296.1 hypothetical protein [Nannocystis bainbridge]